MFGRKKTDIPYVLKRYRNSKSLRLRIKPTGEIVVTSPKRLPLSYIDNFIAEKSEWIIEKLEHFNSLPQPNIKTKKSDYKKYKEQARIIVTEKIKKINLYYKFSFNKIFIRNQKTRWGSCSTKKNLSFNYKIALLPDHLAEYIVIHELCHLKQMNHGPNFWKLVSETMPEYSKIRKELKEFRI